jgi:hypothetical protein
MRQESPGLAASGFQPAGRYGIGFYAIFMLGDTVNVISRRYDAAASDTRVLSFTGGLENRPIIRPARNDEVLKIGGTIVSVKLKDDPYKLGSLLHKSLYQKESLNEVCGHLAPALAVDLSTVEANEPEQVCVLADDWETMPAVDLIRRLSTSVHFSYDYRGFPIDRAAEAIRTIERDGRIIARASLGPPLFISDPVTGVRSVSGVIVSGGLEVGPISGVNGIFVGVPIKADRARGKVIATRDELAPWAAEQAHIWKSAINEHYMGWADDADMLCALGADVAGLQICCSRNTFLDTESLAGWAAERTEIFALDSRYLDVIETRDGLDIWDTMEHLRVDIGENSIIAFDTDRVYTSGWDPFGITGLAEPTDLETDSEDVEDLPRIRWGGSRAQSMERMMIDAIAKGWGLDLSTVLDECTTIHRQEEVERNSVDEDDTVTVYLKWSMRRPSI